MKFSAKQAVKKAPSAWYMSGVNINYSFKTLEQLATELGAHIQDGDVLIVDNANMDKRKAFKKTANGCIIIYVMLLNNNTFSEHDNDNGRMILGDVPMLEFFNV
jgi:hypothetical protein